MITVENTGDIDLQDVKVTDKVPGQLTITSIGNGGTRSGSTITWTNLVLGAGEKKDVSFTARVNDNTGNKYLLVNDVTAVSVDHNLTDTATDVTRVERLPQVAGKVTPVPIPITAKTGAGMLSLISTLLGSTGLVATARKKW